MEKLPSEKQIIRGCEVIGAVANVTRANFLIGIAFYGPLTFTQLTNVSGGPYNPASVKFHLDVLRNASLVWKRWDRYYPTKNGEYMAEFLRAMAEANGRFTERLGFAVDVLYYAVEERRSF